MLKDKIDEQLTEMEKNKDREIHILKKREVTLMKELKDAKDQSIASLRARRTLPSSVTDTPTPVRE